MAEMKSAAKLRRAADDARKMGGCAGDDAPTRLAIAGEISRDCDAVAAELEADAARTLGEQTSKQLRDGGPDCNGNYFHIEEEQAWRNGADPLQEIVMLNEKDSRELTDMAQRRVVPSVADVAAQLNGRPADQEWYCQCGGINTQADQNCKSCHRRGHVGAGGLIVCSEPDPITFTGRFGTVTVAVVSPMERLKQIVSSTCCKG